MLRRMMIVALLLGVPTAMADGISVSSSASGGAAQTSVMLNTNAVTRANARLSGQQLYKALMFTKSTKVPRPSEEGDITF